MFDRRPATANYRVIVEHDFQVGEYLLRVTGPNSVGNYIVDDVVSPRKMKVRAILSDGTINPVCETVYGDTLKKFTRNRVANELAKKIALKDGN